MSNYIDRENAILASFLYANDMGINTYEAFILNSDLFTSAYRRATADKINDETNNDKMYGYLFVTIKDLTKDTKYEKDYLDIEIQTPMPFSVAKRIHAKLENEYKIKIAKGLR